METLMAIWRGQPRIDRPSSTTQPQSTTSGSETGARNNEFASQAASGLSQNAKEEDGDIPNASPAIAMPTIVDTDAVEDVASPQTTPKAHSVSTSSAAVPSLSLSSSPPSAAAVARTVDATAPSTIPSLSTAPLPTPSHISPGMPPPPRPPTMNSTNNSSLMPPPGRPGPPTLNKLPGYTSNAPSPSSTLSVPGSSQQRPNSLANSARQPGTSTLAPPPTHSARPTKPSRKVILTPGHSPLDWARLANSPTSDLRNLPPGAPSHYLRVPPSLLRRHTGRRGTDAWTALGGRVYNISPYLKYHPGGEPELLRCAGRDGTRLFGEVHPWVNYEGMLGACLIGMLVEEGEEESTMDEMD